MSIEQTRAWTMPGSGKALDVVGPDGGGLYSHTTAEEMAEQHPGAVIMTVGDICEEQYRKQTAEPVRWVAISEEDYNDALGALPPAEFRSDSFLMSEPWDHCGRTGQPRSTGYRIRARRFWRTSRPVTPAEHREAIHMPAHQSKAATLMARREARRNP